MTDNEKTEKTCEKLKKLKNFSADTDQEKNAKTKKKQGMKMCWRQEKSSWMLVGDI